MSHRKHSYLPDVEFDERRPCRTCRKYQVHTVTTGSSERDGSHPIKRVCHVCGAAVESRFVGFLDLNPRAN